MVHKKESLFPVGTFPAREKRVLIWIDVKKDETAYTSFTDDSAIV